MSKKTDGARTIVYAEDMSDETLDITLGIAKEAFLMPSAQGPVFSNIAANIRARLDKELDPGHNVIVGTKFGAYVTHEIKTYAYFSVAHGVSVLVWKAVSRCNISYSLQD